MFRLCFIFAIGLLSCGQSTMNKHRVVEVTIDDTINPNLDSASRINDAFRWRKWEKPRGGRYIYLSDDLLKYVAKGHVAIDASYGDLNEDGMFDLVTVTAPANEDSLRFGLGRDDLSRHLLIFLRQKDNFKLAVRNTKAIPSINFCDTIDSYAGHTTLTGIFIINKYCTNNLKSLSEYRFSYVPKLNDWLLDTIVTESYPFSDNKYVLDTVSKKVFGNVSLKTFIMNKDREQIR